MTRNSFLFLLFICLILLTACGNVGGINLAKYNHNDESINEFVMCHGYGCTSRTYAWFTPKQWKSIQKTFKAKSKTAEAEREKIATAISTMEKYISHLIGTEEDQAKAPIFKNSDYELDCIDETVNTSKFLRFLSEDNLLKYHRIGRPAYRGIGTNFMYPHNTATIIDIATNEIFVVDSYVYKNATRPDIRPLNNWLSTRIEDQ